MAAFRRTMAKTTGTTERFRDEVSERWRLGLEVVVFVKVLCW